MRAHMRRAIAQPRPDRAGYLTQAKRELEWGASLNISSMKSAGYSGTPLPQKLGIKSKSRSLVVGGPKNLAAGLGLNRSNSGRELLDFVLLFAKTESELKENFGKLAAKLQPAGMLWVSWPKKTSGVPTDLTEDVVRRVGIAAGLVDVKVCAIDEIWSGLKFVYRLKDRPS
jgi:hypothetical protein